MWPNNEWRLSAIRDGTSGSFVLSLTTALDTLSYHLIPRIRRSACMWKDWILSLSAGGKYRWSIKISRFSTNKSLYLANVTRYCYSNYGSPIGTRMRSIKWCHFQWPRMSLNCVFKVTPVYNGKYLANGYRYGHSYCYSTSNNLQMVQDKSYSYNGGLPESHTWSIEQRRFQWPWRTPNPDFKVRPFFDAGYLQNGYRYGYSY